MEVAHIDAFRARPRALLGLLRRALRDARRQAAQRRARARSWRWSARRCSTRVITQNVDMLHRKAGTRELVEVHGSIATCSCPAAAASVALEEVQARASPTRRRRRARAASAAAAPLKPDVVLFGELLPAAALERARELCEGADVLLCIGSSLEVHPVAGLPLLTQRGRRRGRDPHAGADAARRLAEVRLHGDVVEELAARCSRGARR